LLITLSLVMVLAADCGGESSLVGEQGPDASSDDATTPDARTPTADAASCGGAQEACCNETACDSGLACVEGMCVPVCGGAGQDCCKATACNNGLACVGGKCAVPTAEGGVCGASAEPCCNGTACNAGLACTYGVCVPPCGSHGAACCNGTACNNGLVCDAGTCVALPDASVDVATDVVDAGAVTQPWALSFGQSPGSWMSGVAVDSSANVLVGGSVGWGALVEKLDSAGNPKWQKQLANSGVQSVAFDAQGNAFAGGSGSASTDFGGGPLGSGEFLVKFDAQGNVLWQRGGYQASFACLAVRPNGNVVAVGSLTGPADFGGGPITPTNSKVLVVEFTASNQYVQAATFGASNGSAYATTCALDSTGAIFLGGNFEESITFGGSTFTGPPQGSGSWNFFLAKLDSSFGHLASMDLKSTGYNSWFGSVAVDANDNVTVHGARPLDHAASNEGAGAPDMYAWQESTMKSWTEPRRWRSVA